MLCRVGRRNYPVYHLFCSQPSSSLGHQQQPRATSPWKQSPRRATGTTPVIVPPGTRPGHIWHYLCEHTFGEEGGGATNRFLWFQTISFTRMRSSSRMPLFVTVCSLTATASYCFMGCKLKSFPGWGMGQSTTSYECLRQTGAEEAEWGSSSGNRREMIKGCGKKPVVDTQR